MFHDGVIKGLEGGGNVLYHGCGDAREEAGLHSGDDGVDLATSRQDTGGNIFTTYEEGGKGEG